MSYVRSSIIIGWCRVVWRDERLKKSCDIQRDESEMKEMNEKRIESGCRARKKNHVINRKHMGCIRIEFFNSTESSAKPFFLFATRKK